MSSKTMIPGVINLVLQPRKFVRQPPAHVPGPLEDSGLSIGIVDQVFFVEPVVLPADVRVQDIVVRGFRLVKTRTAASIAEMATRVTTRFACLFP